MLDFPFQPPPPVTDAGLIPSTTELPSEGKLHVSFTKEREKKNVSNHGRTSVLLEVHFALTESQGSAEGEQAYISSNVNHVLTSRNIGLILV